jgi:peptide-methionine (R)-S-oxide reductase
MIEKLIKSKEEWKKIMKPLQYKVMVEKGTEPAFNNEYDNYFEKGIYYCSACDLPLFNSDDKYDAHSGWPSFLKAIKEENVILIPLEDGQFSEVLCARCELHLGHVFNDGPPPIGKRFCMNSVALNLNRANLVLNHFFFGFEI